MRFDEIDSIIENLYKEKYNELPNGEQITDLGGILTIREYVEQNITTNFLENVSLTIDTYSINTLQDNFNNFNKITTVGDGACFIHSFLTSVSKNYRKIPYNKKSEIGTKFRKETYYNIVESINENNQTYFTDQFYKDAMLSRIRNTGHYFTTEDVVLFLKLMNVVNLMAFVLFKDKKYTKLRLKDNFIEFTKIDPNLPYIVTYNTQFTDGGEHFSAILIKYGTENRWFLSDEQSSRFISMYPSGEDDTIISIQCNYNVGDQIVYNSEIYDVVGRRFEEDPPLCTYLTIQHSNGTINEVNTANVKPYNATRTPPTSSSIATPLTAASSRRLRPIPSSSRRLQGSNETKEKEKITKLIRELLIELSQILKSRNTTGGKKRINQTRLHKNKTRKLKKKNAK